MSHPRKTTPHEEVTKLAGTGKIRWVDPATKKMHEANNATEEAIRKHRLQGAMRAQRARWDKTQEEGNKVKHKFSHRLWTQRYMRTLSQERLDQLVEIATSTYPGARDVVDAVFDHMKNRKLRLLLQESQGIINEAIDPVWKCPRCSHQYDSIRLLVVKMIGINPTCRWKQYPRNLDEVTCRSCTQPQKTKTKKSRREKMRAEGKRAIKMYVVEYVRMMRGFTKIQMSEILGIDRRTYSRRLKEDNDLLVKKDGVHRFLNAAERIPVCAVQLPPRPRG